MLAVLRHTGRAATQANCIRNAACALATRSKSSTVYVMDPRLVLVPQDPDASAATPGTGSKIALQVPVTLLPLLSQGSNELSDMDDPMNSWVFGKRGELFDYKYVGSHSSESGMTCILTKEALEAAQSDSNAEGDEWKQFQTWNAQGIHYPHPLLPFLFAGPVLEAATASVYKYEKDGEVVGVMISSDAEEVD